MGLREDVRDWILEFEEHYCREHGEEPVWREHGEEPVWREHGEEPVWREPLVGLADATSPLFAQLGEVAHPAHRMPQDYLPGAVTVVSYFMPFMESVAEDNRAGDRPTSGWAHAYDLTNTMCAEMNRFIAARIEDSGHRAAVPDDAGEILDRTYSRWSQRHVARIAGLGNFGMNNMLISAAGCCGRYFSVVCDVPCEHDAPCTRETCLHRLDGSCGLCMDACPVSVLSDDGFDRLGCEGRCNSNQPLVGFHICGKCMVGMPCTFTDPTADR